VLNPQSIKTILISSDELSQHYLMLIAASDPNIKRQTLSVINTDSINLQLSDLWSVRNCYHQLFSDGAIRLGAIRGAESVVSGIRKLKPAFLQDLALLVYLTTEQQSPVYGAEHYKKLTSSLRGTLDLSVQDSEALYLFGESAFTEYNSP
jgi:hypothetical protein